MKRFRKIIVSLVVIVSTVFMGLPMAYASGNVTVMRVYGADRGGTSLALAQGIYDSWVRDDSPHQTLYADGYSHVEDALCSVPYAAYVGSPLLLYTTDMRRSIHVDMTNVDADGLPSTPMLSYAPTGDSVWITGNTAPPSALSPVQNFAGDLSSQDLALKFANKLPAPTYLFIINEQSYADALSITPYAAHTHSPILYVDQNSVSQSVLDYVKVNQTLPPIMYTDVENPVRFMLLNGEDGHSPDGISTAANWGNGEYIFWLTQDSTFPYTKQDIYNAIKPFTVTPPPKWNGKTEIIYQPKFPSTARMFSVAGGPVVVPHSVVNSLAQMFPIY